MVHSAPQPYLSCEDEPHQEEHNADGSRKGGFLWPQVVGKLICHCRNDGLHKGKLYTKEERVL